MFQRTRWLFAIVLGFLALLAVTVILGYYQTEQQCEQFSASQKDMRTQWESLDEMNPHGAAHYGTYVFKPTDYLSSLDGGVNEATGNVLRVEGHVQNEMVHSEASQTVSISKFGKLKSALLLQYVLPILLIFLSFSSVSSEKRSGRLKLLLLQGVKPLQLVVGKALAVWGVGVFLLLMAMLVFLLFNWNGVNGEVTLRTFLFFNVYALYYFIVTSVTVFFSARWNATAALTSMLGVWTVFLPNIVMNAVEEWHELPTRDTMKTAMKEDRSKGIDGHNPNDKREEALRQKYLDKYKVDSLSQLPINFDGVLMQADEEYGNKVWDKHFGLMRKTLEKQKASYQRSGFLTPFISLQNSSMGFSGSDNLHHQEFLAQVEKYRRTFIKMLNDEHAYGGSTTGDWGWKADNAFFRSVPDFNYRPTPIASIWKEYAVDLLVLLFWSLIAGMLLVVGSKSIRKL